MRSKDPKLKKRIINFVNAFHEEKLRKPTMAEIGEALGIEKSTASRYLREMDKEGLIKYTGREIITPQMLARPVVVPVFDHVPADFSMEEAECPGCFTLPRKFLGEGKFFMVKVSGDSMIGAGIKEGDYVIIKAQASASPGDVVAALVNGKNGLLRQYSDAHGGCLHAENSSGEYADIYEDYSILGIAVKILKDLK